MTPDLDTLKLLAEALALRLLVGIERYRGRELLFRNGGKLMSAAVTREPELAFAAPVELFEGPYTLDFMGHQRWDVAPDGRRFLMVENSQDYRIVIVQNWFEELERLVPTRP